MGNTVQEPVRPRRELRPERAACVPALAVLTTMAVLACGGDGGPAEPETPVVALVEVTPGTDTLIALGQTRQFAAVARDGRGNPITGKTFTWQSSAPAVATVDPATGLVTAVTNGTATITATVDQKSGQASLAVAQQVATVTVTPGTAALSALGNTQQFAAEARDANNNLVSGITFIWLSSNHNVATVSSSGLATAVGQGSATITGAARGIPGTAALTVTQTATQLVFSVQPTHTVAGEALSPAVEVEIRDAGGRRVASARDPVTISATGPAAPTLSGTKTVNAVGGVATFSGLSLDKAALYTLAASSGSLPKATSSGFVVYPGAPKRLAFVGQPPDTVTAGNAISPGVQIAIQDGFGNTVPDVAAQVLLSLSPNLNNGVTLNRLVNLTGWTLFDDLILEKRGYYAFVASSDAFPSATSRIFEVRPAEAAKLGFVVQPRDAAGARLIVSNDDPLAVGIQDRFGNAVTGATNAVTLSIAVNPGGGVLLGTTTADAVGGVARFPGLRIDRPGTGYKLLASATSLTPATSVAFDIRLTFARITAGAGHVCGLTTSNAVYCWGTNYYGQLGDGSQTNRSSPVVAGQQFFFDQVSTGGSHTCALQSVVGAVYCWGANSSGQLGDGTTTDRSSPVPVPTPAGRRFLTVSARGSHTCAVADSGETYCWGSNAYGQLGDGTTTNRLSPTLVSGGLGFVAVSAGWGHTCALRNDGPVYCWGSNFNGELGDGTTTSQTSPTLVTGGIGFSSVSAGNGYTCGVSNVTPGSAYCWGWNAFGQLGDGTQVNRSSPTPVTGTLGFAAVSTGLGHSCGLTPAGAAYCWGSGGSGELGDGTTTSRATPVLVAGGLTFARIATGGTSGESIVGYSCGVTTSGEAYCWGTSAYGALGNGASSSSSATPVRVVQ